MSKFNLPSFSNFLIGASFASFVGIGICLAISPTLFNPDQNPENPILTNLEKFYTNNSQ